MARVTPWSELANAIVLQAVKDYRMARAALHDDPTNYRAMQMYLETRQFFGSSWYEMLTDVHPVYLLEKLDKEEPDYKPKKGAA